MFDPSHNEETELAARNNLAQDLLLLGRCQEGWKHYAKRFNRKPGNHPLFQSAFGPSHRGPLKPGRPLLLMSEQGFGDTLQFSRYALHLQHQGFDVTVLSQPALVPLLREGIGLKNVIDQIDIREWNKQQPNWLPLLDLLPTPIQELWALSVMAICKLKQNESKDGQPFCDEDQGSDLSLCTGRATPSMSTPLFKRRSISSNAYYPRPIS